MKDDWVMRNWLESFRSEIVGMWTGGNSNTYGAPGPVLGVGSGTAVAPPHVYTHVTKPSDFDGARELIQMLSERIHELEAQAKIIFLRCMICGDDMAGEKVNFLACQPCQLAITYARYKMLEEAKAVFETIDQEAREL